MPTSLGPKSTSNQNTQLSYDTGDTINSYIGEPTTNICTGEQYSIYNEGATNYRNNTDILPPSPGYEVVKVVANTPGVYGQSILWRALYSSAPASITNSVYAYLLSGTYVQVGQHWFPWNYGSPKFISLGQWVRISESYTINEGGSYEAAAMVYSTDGVAYFSMPQYEMKTHMTPFIGFNQTRSTTQGLVPLIGNSTLDLANMSYNSNAQMTFDGTDDIIVVSNPSAYSFGTSDFSLEFIFNKAASGGDNGMLVENRGDNLVGMFLYINMSGVNTVLALNYNNSQQWVTFSSYGAYQPNKNYHLVITVDRATRQASQYVNGTLVQVASISHSNSITPAGGYRYNIGQDLGGSPFYGKIPLHKNYTRILTPFEIQQNYQQYKTRFNL